MLQVSTGALAALGFVLAVCYLLPIALFYVMYRFSDSKLKTFAVGAMGYFTTRFAVEMPIGLIISHYTNLSENTPVYAVYLLLLCPLIFVGVNFAALKIFGKDILSTGNSLMFASGYVTLQNIVEVGFVGAWYFITLQEIRSVGSYIVVSDTDFASASDMVSASNLVSESIYAEMQTLCSMPASYFISMGLERLWGIVAYSAMILVIWLAVRKRGALPLLGVAFGMRLLAGVPTLLSDRNVIESKWVSVSMIVAILIIICAAAVVCWRKYIDKEDR